MDYQELVDNMYGVDALTRVGRAMTVVRSVAEYYARPGYKPKTSETYDYMLIEGIMNA